ncbi:transposase IS4 family protein [Bacillus sp. OxB-1]|uniref:IS5 family transposase n=1 Tax=Bacillus sp. (strain OxB-1) TaxID=98228 RepID=UPI0005822E87|nr:IS5 family transposase [Bacillus sp. OxB-1]BAQ08789.1 transposase IS4 family protein [Bacillus sp. OxB-1]BAQ10533.1 transposase IS4 family protein [Bacillus sp. OxB-1]BAQ11646.1 transposase IS4 family protein [Bacillus sp. OxB-1]
MYEHNAKQMILPHEFFLPFGGHLNPDNRWVRMASVIPWADLEEAYLESLGDPNQGSKAYTVQLALGALIIKERLRLSDGETVEAITENPYMQYFIGLPAFQETPPFHASSLTHFRKRFNADLVNQVNESITAAHRKPANPKDSDGPDDDEPRGGSGSPAAKPEARRPEESAPIYKQGKLLIDATCAPSDIAYPTDIGLLNQAREKLETMIDRLHAKRGHGSKKPRTYRRKARKEYLALSKQRKPGYEKIQACLKGQLSYVRRDLKHVEDLANEVGLDRLTRAQYKDLLVIQELFRQQTILFEGDTHSIQDRVVSIAQPYIRPIVRGKAKASVEFGAKLSVSLVDGYAYLETLQWDAYNEGTLLKDAILAYKERFGHYPEAVLADTIYRTRDNRKFCQELGIRLSGPKLGRPAKDQHVRAEQKKLEKQDHGERNAIEGKFGEGKRAYGLGLIRTRLQTTSETTIALQLVIMNLEKILRDTFLSFFLHSIEKSERLFSKKLILKVA